jgi:xylose isomerase
MATSSSPGMRSEAIRPILDGTMGLGELADWAVDNNIDPVAVSGRQERLENTINRKVWSHS